MLRLAKRTCKTGCPRGFYDFFIVFKVIFKMCFFPLAVFNCSNWVLRNSRWSENATDVNERRKIQALAGLRSAGLFAVTHRDLLSPQKGGWQLNRTL